MQQISLLTGEQEGVVERRRSLGKLMDSVGVERAWICAAVGCVRLVMTG